MSAVTRIPSLPVGPDSPDVVEAVFGRMVTAVLPIVLNLGQALVLFEQLDALIGQFGGQGVELLEAALPVVRRRGFRGQDHDFALGQLLGVQDDLGGDGRLPIAQAHIDPGDLIGLLLDPAPLMRHALERPF